MGRLIDETNLMNLLYALDDARHDLCYAIKKIPELPTVEAIPKDQYENRLKADMRAMLEEIDLEMSEQSFGIQTEPWEVVEKLRKKIIQQKINSLKEVKDGENNY